MDTPEAKRVREERTLTIIADAISEIESRETISAEDMQRLVILRRAEKEADTRMRETY